MADMRMDVSYLDTGCIIIIKLLSQLRVVELPTLTCLLLRSIAVGTYLFEPTLKYNYGCR